MAKQKKKSKGPEHRNSNYILKNGKTNKTSMRKEKESDKPLKIKNAGKKGFFAGFSNSIANASNSITKIFNKGQ